MPSIQIPKLLSLGMLTQQLGAGPWDLEVQQVPQVILRKLQSENSAAGLPTSPPSHQVRGAS